MRTFVIDASKSSASEASKSSEAARLSSLTASKTSPGSVSATTTEDGQAGQPTSGDGETGGAGGAGDGSDGSDGSDGGTGDGTNGGDTTNDSTNNGTGKSNTSAIVGGVVGGLSGLILLILALLLARRNKWKCTMKRSSNKNTKRSDRSERKKNYKNALVKEIHHGEKDSYESSHRNSETYTRGPPPARDPGAAPAQAGSGGLFSWTKNKGPTTHTSTSHYSAPVGSGAPAPALQDQRQVASTNTSQQHGTMEYTNPSSSTNAQRDGLGGNGGNTLISNQGGPTATGYQYSQTQSPPPQSQHLAPLTNTVYSSTSVQATGPNDNSGGIHPGAATAMYQQPQHTGNGSGPPNMMPASTTDATGSSQPQNFVLAMNHYATNTHQNTNISQNESRHPDAAPTAAIGYQHPQFTGSSSSASGMAAASRSTADPLNTGGLTSGTSMSPQGTGAIYNGGNFPPGSSAAPGYQQQPQLSSNNSNSQTPESGPSGTATGAGAGAGAGSSAGAGALAVAGVHLDINSNNVLQKQQQQNHHYYHQQPENVTATGGIQGSQQHQQQQPRYMDSSTMTTDPVSPASEGRHGAAHHEQSQAASYQQPQYTGVSDMTSTTRGSVDAGYYQPSHITGLNHHHHHSMSVSPTTPVTITGGGYQQQVMLPQSTTAGTTTTTTDTATSPVVEAAGNAWNGSSKGTGTGAWYQRPAGVQVGDQPVELEARPALRKVD
ncbi:hypothetical protein SLS62_000857 [Diatrype stigma]|uniref:Uncharacterized protein n=1 Tax=Diatrype stigma TaxID=117547 RepID=A0AAN9YWL2_9PEZI